MGDKELSFFTGNNNNKTNRFFIAVDERTDKVVGTSACYTSLVDGEATINLTRVNVDIKYRGQGVASRLIDAVKTHAVDSGFKTLDVSTLNSQTVAVKMYGGSKMGGRLHRVTKNMNHSYEWIGYITGMRTNSYKIPLIN